MMNKESFKNLVKNNKVMLVGRYRYCNDFKYVYERVFGNFFDNMFIIENERLSKEDLNKITKLAEEYETVIACLNKHDFQTVKDLNIIWMEDLFGLLDEVSVGWYDTDEPSDEYHRIPVDKKLALWGMNDLCDFFINHQKNLKIECIIDSDPAKRGKIFGGGVQVVNPDDIKNYKDYYIIIMCRARDAVLRYLESKGINSEDNINFYGNLVGKKTPSQMMKATIYDISKEPIGCSLPFNYTLYTASGDMMLCGCVPIIAGNILRDDLENVWNSVSAIIARLSMVNQTYTFCDKYICESFPVGKAKPLSEPLNLDYSKEKRKLPSKLSLNISNTCNLYCKTCRNCFIADTGMQKENSMKMAKKIIPYIKTAQELRMSGYGEVFASESYRYVLDNIEEVYHENLKWIILTNGVLMTKERLDKIVKIGGKNVMITVSVDAAEKETYQELRRGGDWDKLMENLKYAGEYAKRGEIGLFQLNFVVQKINIAQMNKFVCMAKELGATKVYFSAVSDWGTYEPGEFERISLRDQNGNIKKEYRKFLEDPILKSDYVLKDFKLTYYGEEN